MKWTKGLLIFSIIAALPAYAGFRAFSGATDLRIFNSLVCSTGMTCTRVADKLVMVSSPTLSGPLTLAEAEVMSNAVDDVVQFASNDAAMIVSVYSPLTSDGDATLRLIADASADSGDDWQIQHDGATNDLLFQNDKSGSQATFFSLTEDGDASLLGTTPYLTLGDAGAEDTGLKFDGHSGGFDFNISVRDSTDDLVIGVGLVAGTTDAIRIDENQDVTFVQNVLGLGTDSLSGFLQKQTASTTAAITAAQCGGSFVSNSADTMDLPEASTVLGCRLTFISGTADDFHVNPADGTDVIGVITASGGTITPSAGDRILLTDVGTSVTVEAIAADLWAIVAHNGPITDAN